MARTEDNPTRQDTGVDPGTRDLLEKARPEILRAVRDWSRGWPADRPISILYITPVAHDTPRAIAETFERTRLIVSAGVSTHERVEARPLSMPAPDFTDRVGVNSVDYLISDMALHGLDQIEVLTMLRAFDRTARAGLLWADRRRHAGLLRRLGVGTSGDGFTRREARDLARRVDLGWLQDASRSRQEVFVLSGERRGAWTGPPPIVRA